MKPQLFNDKKKLRWIPYGYVFILFFSVSPFLSVIAGSAIGNSLGCNINEAGTDRCIRIGIPFGDILNDMVVAGWLFFCSIPLGLLSLIIFTFVSINDYNYFKNN